MTPDARQPDRTCARCGAILSPDHDPSRPCPRCLLRVGLESVVSAGVGQRVPAPGITELAPHFPRLELLALVGEGGMGAVYKARDKELERLVALKILTVKSDESAQFDERFAREARAMARLAHTNIAAVFDHGKSGPWSYLVLEYVDGENLRSVMRSRSVGPAEALRWVGEICAALQYAHDNGVVHRDIKPENVLVDAKGHVKVVDFGLAKLLDRRPGEATLTGAQQSLGTWHYMAPEQYEKPQSVDHRADIYSLGVVLYELLTGQVPVGRFDPPSHKIAVDVRVDEVVLKALAREPDKRYQAANEVQSRVEGLASGAPTQRRDAALVSSAPSRGVSPWVVVAIVFGVLFFGAILVALGFAALAPQSMTLEQSSPSSDLALEGSSVIGWLPALALLAAGAVIAAVALIIWRVRRKSVERSTRPASSRAGWWIAALAVALGALTLFGCFGYWFVSARRFAANDVPTEPRLVERPGGEGR